MPRLNSQLSRDQLLAVESWMAEVEAVADVDQYLGIRHLRALLMVEVANIPNPGTSHPFPGSITQR